MNSNLKRFIVKITGIAAIIAFFGWLAFNLLIPEYYLPVMPWGLLFFLLMTILAHAFQLNQAAKGVPAFTRSSMVVTFLRLVVYSIVAVIYIALKPHNAVVFVIYLMLLYMLFTFFEVAEMIKIFKRK